MKRILTVLAIAATFFQVANAQNKTVAAAKTAAEAAKAATEDAKKNVKFATWMKYGQTLVQSYEASQGNGWLGATKQDLQIIMGNEKPASVEQVTIGGQNFQKESYDTKTYYFNEAGQLAVMEVTKEAVPGALETAINAYAKAAELDVKGAKTKDIKAALEGIANKLTDEAYNAYTFGDMAKASQMFEKVVKANGTAPLSKLDTNSIYNAGFTAWMAGDNARAKEFFQTCAANNYYYENGEVYAKLADIEEKLGNKEGTKNILEEGFTKFPQSQSILVGLINYYVGSGENTGRLFELLGEAKKNEPNNASLYYVEGNIHDKLGEVEEAVASYRQCAEIDPNYEYGYIGEGILYYNLAVKIQEEAQNEMDDAKYMALVEKFENTLKSCIDPFEKALDLCKDDSVKGSIAEYLKNACFRFRTSDESYAAKYEKYAAIVAGN